MKFSGSLMLDFAIFIEDSNPHCTTVPYLCIIPIRILLISILLHLDPMTLNEQYLGLTAGILGCFLQDIKVDIAYDGLRGFFIESNYYRFLECECLLVFILVIFNYLFTYLGIYDGLQL